MGVLSPEGWVEGQPMNEARAHAASVQLGDKWMVSGGRRDGGSFSQVASTELLSADGSWSNYINLPKAMSRHCLVAINSTHIFMSGGNLNSFISSTQSSAYIFDSVQEQWTEMENMAVARSDHGCALLPDGNVLVAGGSGLDGKDLSSTESFSLSSLTWSPGPELATGISLLAMATVETETLLFGGSFVGAFGSSTTSDVIYQLSQYGLSWTDVGRMNTARQFFGVLPITFDDCVGLNV